MMLNADGRRPVVSKRLTATAMALWLVSCAVAAQGNGEYKPPEYKPPEYKQPEYKPPEYKPPEYKPKEYKPPQYPQYKYPQYPKPKFAPGQYQGSPQDQQACINDVFQLCQAAIPDVTRIIGCLQSNKPKLSPPCRAVFARSYKNRKGKAGK